VNEKYPKLIKHLESHGVDITLASFNWFLTVFVDCTPPEVAAKSLENQQQQQQQQQQQTTNNKQQTTNNKTKSEKALHDRH